MGYYTYHTLRVYDENMHYLPGITDDHAVLLTKKVYGTESDDDDSLFSSNAKWYECENDMIEYSKLFPDLLFCIEGDGEESDDFWISYFFNGKSWIGEGKVVYPEFNISLLK